MGWHLLSSFHVPGHIHIVMWHHEMRPWVETGQRTKVDFFLLKTSGTATPDGRSQDCGAVGRLFHPSEPQPPLLVISAPPPCPGQRWYPVSNPYNTNSFYLWAPPIGQAHYTVHHISSCPQNVVSSYPCVGRKQGIKELKSLAPSYKAKKEQS